MPEFDIAAGGMFRRFDRLSCVRQEPCRTGPKRAREVGVQQQFLPARRTSRPLGSDGSASEAAAHCSKDRRFTMMDFSDLPHHAGTQWSGGCSEAAGGGPGCLEGRPLSDDLRRHEDGDDLSRVLDGRIGSARSSVGYSTSIVRPGERPGADLRDHLAVGFLSGSCKRLEELRIVVLQPVDRRDRLPAAPFRIQASGSMSCGSLFFGELTRVLTRYATMRSAG